VDDCREARDNGRLHTRRAEHIRAAQVGDVVRHLRHKLLKECAQDEKRLSSYKGSTSCAGMGGNNKQQDRASKNPFALAPRAWTTRSGIRSRSNCTAQAVHSGPHACRSTTATADAKSRARRHLGELLDQVLHPGTQRVSSPGQNMQRAQGRTRNSVSAKRRAGRRT